jgi:hypothetical protein
MSQTDYNSQSISWSIDRNPDYGMLRNFIPTTRNFREPLYRLGAMEYDAMNNNPELTSLIQRHQAYIERYNTADNTSDSDLDFVQASDYLIDYNTTINSYINCIVNEFQLSEEEKNCCICMSDKNNEQMCILNCRHTFCLECIDIHLNANKNCPLCRTYIKQVQTQNIQAKQQFHH